MRAKKNHVLAAILACIALICGMTYFHYEKFFLPNTMIGEYNVSELSPKDAEKEIKKELIGTYSLAIKDIDGNTAIVQGNDIGIDINLDTNGILNEQKPYLLFDALSNGLRYDLTYEVVFDAEKVEERLNRIKCFDETNMEEPQNAYLSGYLNGKGYEIIEETKGSVINKEKSFELIMSAIENLETFIDLAELGCYKEAEIKKDSPDLVKELGRMNESVSAVIIYDVGEQKEILDSDTYHEWLTYNEDGSFSVDEEKAAEYVQYLMKKHDTAYTTREFVTTDGDVVDVTGPYGYRTAKNDERNQMIADILNGGETERKPVYVREGAGREGADYGNTYVEINLTGQKVYLYVDGELIKSSDCVTGDVSKNYTTPPGIYPMTYTQKDAVLRGPGYASPVEYWMPFNGGIGLHDASWRSSFGGNIYKTNGSHGCINLPYEMAKTIFEYAYAGMPVICYN